MAVPLLHVLVLVAANELQDPRTTSAQQAFQRSVGPDYEVRLVAEQSRAPTDAPDIWVFVQWSEGHTTASVRVQIPHREGDLRRVVRFRPDDLPEEQGRTIGYVLASMLPESRSAEPTEPLPPAPLESAEQRRIRVRKAEDDALSDARTSLDLVLRGTEGFGAQSAGGLGFAADARRQVYGSVWAVLTAGIRFNDVPAAQASSTLRSVGLGVATTKWLGPTRRTSLGARFALLLVDQAMAHFSGDGDEPGVVQQRQQQGAAEAEVEFAWRFAGAAALRGGLGVECVPSPPRVFVEDQLVVQAPTWRGFVTAGLRAYF